ncbi:MAG: hypothetical protein COY58_08930 [Gammaproteobacteria bacterium CG_4_10_14_0_8_um_filter_38_16]|nr:MAG: hypothetical protein COY58_08930 [Gammaproteobacteria bacterium CG_4_10_14_0_8_um_filter_38_16]PJA02946.1 MAG: hypothetical protein COX72_07955 [Gammaproteobacteria bacterium CG_4_10_14_0_2_um_filter_38_22]PJB11387.1 MAG: hypothetical protein CO120_00285 [Gammaproteobacteria bacterium CG_4_9_14_3_um_filter_38_9]
MSVKKILLLGATGLAAVSMTAAMAGGYTHEPVVSDSGYYVEGHLGYARQNYFDNQQWAVSSGVDNNNGGNARGGFAAGLDAGYKINNNFAVELGWFYLPSVNVASQGFSPVRLKSWALYLAGKYMTPVSWMNNTDWFFKLGVAYRQATVSTTGTVIAGPTTLGISKGKSTFVRPMFATGLDYSFSDTWSGIVQYAYFMGARNSFPLSTSANGALGTVAANVFTLGLGYKFTV